MKLILTGLLLWSTSAFASIFDGTIVERIDFTISAKLITCKTDKHKKCPKKQVVRKKNIIKKKPYSYEMSAGHYPGGDAIQFGGIVNNSLNFKYFEDRGTLKILTYVERAIFFDGYGHYYLYSDFDIIIEDQPWPLEFDLGSALILPGRHSFYQREDIYASRFKSIPGKKYFTQAEIKINFKY